MSSRGDGAVWLPSLAEAIETQDLKRVRQLAEDIDLNVVPADGWTYLCLASTYGSQQIVRSLLEAGADPNAVAPGKRSPLGIAADMGYIGNVRALLAAGADVNGSDAGATPLLRSLLSGASNVRIFRLLLENGADPYEAEPGVEPPATRTYGRYTSVLEELGYLKPGDGS